MQAVIRLYREARRRKLFRTGALYVLGAWLMPIPTRVPNGANAFGARRGFREHRAVGLELEGSLESGGSDELMLGYYFESASALTLNLGIGAALDEGPDVTLRTAIIWQFG